MSSFNKLFTGDSKKKQEAASPPPAKSEAEKMAEKKIKIEVKLNELDLKIKNYEEKEKNCEYKIEILKYKAKELIGVGKEKDAKRCVDEASEVLKQAQDYTGQKKVLIDQKFQLEQAIMDMETIEALDNISSFKEAKEVDEKKIKIEAALNELDEKIKNSEEIEKQIEDKISILTNKVKQLVEVGKKEDAKKYVDAVLEMQKQAAEYARQKKVLVDKKFQLEQAIMDMETIEALDYFGNFKEVKEIDQKKLKIETALNELDVKIKNSEEKEKDFQYKIETLRNKAKELIAVGKEKDAKRCLDEGLEVQKQAKNYAGQKKVLIDQKFQLEQAIMDMETIEALEIVSNHLKMQEMQSQKPVDIACEGFKVQWKKIDQLDSESDKQKAEKMFKELLREVKEGKEGKAKIETGKSVNLAVAPSETSKNVSEKEHEEETENMPANL